MTRQTRGSIVPGTTRLGRILLLSAILVACITSITGCKNRSGTDNSQDKSKTEIGGFPLKENPPGGWYQFARNEEHDTYIGGKLGKLRYLGTLNSERIFKKQGRQHGGMIAAGDDFYVPNDEGAIVCIDRKTGDTKWTSAQYLPQGRFFQAGKYVRGIVYYTTQPGGLMAFDAATGARLWEELEPLAIKGVKTTPVLAENNLVFADLTSKLISVDALSGEMAWEKELVNSEPCDCDPTPCGKWIAFGTPSGILYAVAPGSGKVGWANSFFLGIHSTPVYTGGRLFFCVNDKAVYGVSVEDGHVVLRFPTEGSSGATPLVHGDSLVTADDKNYLYCVSISDGKLRWKTRTKTPACATILGFDDALVVMCSILEPINLDIAKARGELDDYLLSKGPFLAITKEAWNQARENGGGAKLDELKPQSISSQQLLAMWPQDIRVVIARRAEAVVFSWDGREMQQFPLPTALQCEPMAVDGKIYALDIDGFIQVFEYGEGG